MWQQDLGERPGDACSQFTQPLMCVVSLPPVMVMEPDSTRTAQPASPPLPGLRLDEQA